MGVLEALLLSMDPGACGRKAKQAAHLVRPRRLATGHGERSARIKLGREMGHGRLDRARGVGDVWRSNVVGVAVGEVRDSYARGPAPWEL